MMTSSPELSSNPALTSSNHPIVPHSGSQILPWLAGGGAVGAGLSSLFSGGDDNFDTSEASGYLSQIPDILKKYFAPYQQMATDPTGQMSRLGQGYKASPGYEYELSQALKAGGSAAAAGGMAGSPMQQQQAQQTATGLAGQDYYKYLQDAMGMYMGGAKGFSQLGENLSSNLMSQSQLAQLRQEEEQRQRMQRESDIWGTIGTVGGAAAKAAPFL